MDRTLLPGPTGKRSVTKDGFALTGVTLMRSIPISFIARIVIAFALGVYPAYGTDRPRTAHATESEITAALREGVERGLSWLAAQQAEDGSFGSLSHYGPHVGITGLAGLAFLSEGNTPGRGRYGHVVEQSLSFILAHSSESGLLAAETSHGPMYGHGFASLFLAQAYGMTRRTETRERLRRAVRLIVNTQNNEGGW